MFPRSLFILLCLMITTVAARSQQPDVVPPTKAEALSNCLGTLDAYADKWRKDSLGANGFRDIFSDCVLMDCAFTGVAWSRIAKFFGKPGSARNDETGHTVYRFLTADTRDFLEIVVSARGIMKSMRPDRSCS